MRSSAATLNRLPEKVCKALAVGGTHTPFDIERDIALGKKQHWEDGETVVVTMICQEPLVKICKVFLVAGDLETAWKIHDEQIVPWAKSIGCTRMSGEGRMGWAKSAREHGYTNQWLCVAKDI